jgi:hypothetical protein
MTDSSISLLQYWNEMNYIEIQELDLIGENNKGATYGFETYARTGFIWAERKAGTVSGNHFHKGISDTKNPEVLLLTQGEAEIDGRLESGEEVFRQVVKAPVIVKVYPNVIHTVSAITDIQFLEFNSLAEHKADTFYPEQ